MILWKIEGVDTMIKCLDCGWIGFPEDLTLVRESRGEFWGMPAYEDMYYCPMCGRDSFEDYTGEPEDEEDESPVIQNLGDVNFLEYGALLINQEDTSYNILYCVPYSDTDDLYQFTNCIVDISDSWIKKQDVLSCLGMDEDTYNPEQFALGCIEYYGANNFGDVMDMNKEQILEILYSYDVKVEVE